MMRCLCCSLLIFCSLLAVQLAGQGVLQQTINIELKGEALPTALRNLATHTGVPISFSANYFEADAQVEEITKGRTLAACLDQILAGNSVSYKYRAGRILLTLTNPIRYTFSGYVEDEKSGERLLAATIYCPDIEQGTVTNEYGFFSLPLPPGVHELVCSYLGYEQRSWRLQVGADRQETIQLTSGRFLSEVVVTPDSLENPYFVDSEDGYLTVSPALNEVTPSLAGEHDPVRTAQLLPGVQAGVDGFGGLQVRGGDNGQNKLLLDGVPVYIPYHLLGMFSIFNGSAVQSAQLLTGDFSARYGGSLSSIYDVRIREGNRYRWSGNGQVNLTNASFLLEGPLVKEKTSILTALRLNHSSFLFSPVINRALLFSNDESIGSDYFDLNLKVNHQISNKDRVYLSLYRGGDILGAEDFFDDGEEREETSLELLWGNTIGSLRWNHLFNKRLFANLTLTYSLYSYEYTLLNEEFDDEDNIQEAFFYYRVSSENNDRGLRYDLDYLPANGHHWRFGVGAFDRTFAPNIDFFDEEDEEVMPGEVQDIDDFDQFLQREEQDVEELYVYAENRLPLTNALKLRLGFRASAFFSENERFTALEPRAQLHYQRVPKWSWQFSVNRMVQYLHLIASSSLQLPTDLWLPSNAEILPQTAWHMEGQWRYRPIDALRLSVSGYYKLLDNLYSLPAFTSTLDLEDELGLGSSLVVGSGRVAGLECLVEYHADKQGALLSYALTDAKRTQQQDGVEVEFPADFDSRHQFKLLLYRHLGAHWRISTNWIYSSSTPRRYLQVSDLGNTFVTVTLDENAPRNEVRSIPYHRWDMEVSYTRQTGRLQHQFQLGAYNVYDRQNVAFYEVVEEEEAQPSPKAVTSLPILPTVSYRLKF